MILIFFNKKGRMLLVTISLKSLSDKPKIESVAHVSRMICVFGSFENILKASP